MAKLELELSEEQLAVLYRALNRERDHAVKNIKLAKRRGFVLKEGSRDINFDTLTAVAELEQKLGPRPIPIRRRA